MSPSTIQLLASSDSSQGPFRNASMWSIHVKVKCSLTSGTLPDQLGVYTAILTSGERHQNRTQRTRPDGARGPGRM